jgi:hypothetical protein
MKQSVVILNYLAFFILFVTGFVFIFNKNASILGYALIFITNMMFMLFAAALIVPEIASNNFFIAIIARCSVMITIIFHFVSLIFVLMMIYKLHVKYSASSGLPINIPEPYKSQLYKFNLLMITTFCISAIILSIIFFKPEKLDVNFYELLKNINMFLFSRNYLLFITLALSISTVVISSFQVKTADSFAKLSRQQINIAESKGANNKHKLLSLPE